jgi:serine/threonine protein kinase
MELMDHSLEDVIDNKTEQFHLALTTVLSILIDIANGLAYLHDRTPRVLHRDLTARNVLLDKFFNAKITDFGNSRIIDAAKVGATMTQAPGTSVYMPPEALDPHSKYSDRLDIFSFGHLALYTLIRKFPKDILPATYIGPEGRLIARTELERRSQYMESLDLVLPELDHDLYRLVQQCLGNDPTKRPDAIGLLCRLQEILCLQYVCNDLYPEPGTFAVTSSDSQTLDVKQEKKVKTGLIEKKSWALSKWSGRDAWRAHSFTIDYVRGIFQCSRKRVRQNTSGSIVLFSQAICIKVTHRQESNNSIG